MNRTETVTVIRDGKAIEGHVCGSNWAAKVDYSAPEGTRDFQRICKDCGKVERVIQTLTSETFDEAYSRIYGEEK
jgi:hypothetical protein